MMPTGDIIEFGFLVITISSFVRLAFVGDSNERIFQKIIGGFAVFIVALLSNNPYVMTVSLFIGGLIIASEHFMKILVAILRADSSDIKDLVRIESATKEEVEEKLQVDQQEVQEVQTELSDSAGVRGGGGSYTPQPHITFEERGLIEKKVTEDLIKRFGLFFEPNAKVYFQDRAMIFDGIIKHQLSADNLSFNKNTEATAVEIKYLASLKSFSVDMIITRTLGRIFGSFEKMDLLIVLVTQGITNEEAWGVYKKIMNRYPRIYLAIYNYNSKNESVEQMVMRYDK